MKLKYLLFAALFISAVALAGINEDPPCPGPACPLDGGYYPALEKQWIDKHQPEIEKLVFRYATIFHK
jgi:hypothetical protein